MKIGKTCIFEIPIPELDVRNIDDEFSRHLSESIEAFQNMERNFKSGEWNEVVKNSRPIFELLRNEEKISEILKNAGYNNEMADAFFNSIRGLFDYTSKYIHRLDRNKELMSAYSAQKEEAYLIYTTSASLINLINRKMEKSYKTSY